MGWTESINASTSINQSMGSLHLQRQYIHYFFCIRLPSLRSEHIWETWNFSGCCLLGRFISYGYAFNPQWHLITLKGPEVHWAHFSSPRETISCFCYCIRGKRTAVYCIYHTWFTMGSVTNLALVTNLGKMSRGFYDGVKCGRGWI